MKQENGAKITADAEKNLARHKTPFNRGNPVYKDAGASENGTPVTTPGVAAICEILYTI